MVKGKEWRETIRPKQCPYAQERCRLRKQYLRSRSQRRESHASLYDSDPVVTALINLLNDDRPFFRR